MLAVEVGKVFGFWISVSRRADFEGEREKKESDMTLKFWF